MNHPDYFSSFSLLTHDRSNGQYQMYGPPHSLPSSASRMATCKDASHARAACWRISLAVRRIFSSHTRAGRSVPRPCRRRVCIAPVFPPRACRLLAPWGPYDPVVLEFLVALPLPVLAHLPPPNQRRSGVAARGREKASHDVLDLHVRELSITDSPFLSSSWRW